ncbi:MAG: 3-deoxy-7-phosphoheptulonate synthase [Candidatus Tectomicrobia bacterium]|nr:3-deoxy-7-phosphoheptulonate synthase [Candidatus Tectomicrobia bacterium]
MEKNFPLVSKRDGRERSVVRVGDVEIGGERLVVMAGPCTVEDPDQLLDIARHAKASGATLLRGGAYKPLTFPYRSETTFELREVGLEYLRQVKAEVGLPVVTEVTDVRLVGRVAEVADMFQVGARNMQNFVLLEELGKCRKPVLLKRHFGCGLRDWLGAAEYLYYHGSDQVVLCERGIVAPHTHEPTSRFIVDIQAIPAVRAYSHLPIVVDPSHATFNREYVPPVARAAVAAGADGLIIEVHPVPEKAAVDPLQALSYEAFDRLMDELRGIAPVVGRTL